MPYQGFFRPQNPAKYIGNVNQIIYRSGLELRLMNSLDKQANVIAWNSEEIVIPYLSPKDGKMHRYFVDFVAKIKTKSGETKVLLIEVKPYKQCFPPKEPKTKRQKARHLNEMKTYYINQAKWKAAIDFCETKGWEFKVITDRELTYAG